MGTWTGDEESEEITKLARRQICVGFSWRATERWNPLALHQHHRCEHHKVVYRRQLLNLICAQLCRSTEFKAGDSFQAQHCKETASTTPLPPPPPPSPPPTATTTTTQERLRSLARSLARSPTRLPSIIPSAERSNTFKRCTCNILFSQAVEGLRKTR